MAAKDREAKLQDIIEPTLDALGYGLVRVQFLGNRQPTLQIMAERHDGVAMSIDDCTTISRALSAKLDAADPIEEAYSLEVSSAGIERPLVRPADYRRFKGSAAKIETRVKIAERRKFVGRIAGATDTHVRLALDPAAGPDGDVEIPIADITRAKLLAADLPAAASGHAPPAANRGNRSNGIARP
jgi:ribosome maturation factor RimP